MIFYNVSLDVIQSFTNYCMHRLHIFDFLLQFINFFPFFNQNLPFFLVFSLESHLFQLQFSPRKYFYCVFQWRLQFVAAHFDRNDTNQLLNLLLKFSIFNSVANEQIFGVPKRSLFLVLILTNTVCICITDTK